MSSSTTKPSTVTRSKHLLSNVLYTSDSDGVDSPTYDGDIESSTTAAFSERERDVGYAALGLGHHQASSTSTLNTPLHLDSTVTSPFSGPPGTTQSVSTPILELPANPTDLAPTPSHPTLPTEPVPASGSSLRSESRLGFNPAALTPADIQQFIQEAIKREGELGKVRKYRINEPPEGRPVRIYADGG
jgi:choline-phosphate cytidylyltransferase